MSPTRVTLSNTVSQIPMNEFTCCLYLFRIYWEIVYYLDDCVSLYDRLCLFRVYFAGVRSIGMIFGRQSFAYIRDDKPLNAVFIRGDSASTRIRILINWIILFLRDNSNSKRNILSFYVRMITVLLGFFFCGVMNFRWSLKETIADSNNKYINNYDGQNFRCVLHQVEFHLI